MGHVSEKMDAKVAFDRFSRRTSFKFSDISFTTRLCVFYKRV